MKLKEKLPKAVLDAIDRRRAAELMLLEAARRWTETRHRLARPGSSTAGVDDPRIADSEGAMHDAAEKVREADWSLDRAKSMEAEKAKK